MFDRDTQRSRGFGFITYEDPETSRHLLSMGHEGEPPTDKPLVGRLQMRDKTVEIKAAEPKEPTNRSGYNSRDRRAPPTKKAYGAPFPYPNFMYGPADYSMPYTQPPYYGPGVVAGYMAPMYYPTYEDMPPPPPPPPVMNPVDGAYLPPAPVDAMSATGAPAYAFIPFMAPPAATPYAMPNTVMQQVAPGIPGKEDDGDGGEATSPPPPN